MANFTGFFSNLTSICIPKPEAPQLTREVPMRNFAYECAAPDFFANNPPEFVYDIDTNRLVECDLEDVQSSHESNPHNFLIPSLEERRDLRQGDWVRLHFKVKGGLGLCERMWVVVHGRAGDNKEGGSAADPVYMGILPVNPYGEIEASEKLGRGDRVQFRLNNVGRILIHPGHPKWADLGAMQCLLSNRIAKEGHPVMTLTKSYAENNGDEAQDSGWTAFSGVDEPDEFKNDPENWEVVSLQVLLSICPAVEPYLHQEYTGPLELVRMSLHAPFVEKILSTPGSNAPHLDNAGSVTPTENRLGEKQAQAGAGAPVITMETQNGAGLKETKGKSPEVEVEMSTMPTREYDVNPCPQEMEESEHAQTETESEDPATSSGEEESELEAVDTNERLRETGGDAGDPVEDRVEGEHQSIDEDSDCARDDGNIQTGADGNDAENPALSEDKIESAAVEKAEMQGGDIGDEDDDNGSTGTTETNPITPAVDRHVEI